MQNDSNDSPLAVYIPLKCLIHLQVTCLGFGAGTLGELFYSCLIYILLRRTSDFCQILLMHVSIIVILFHNAPLTE